MRRCTSCLFFTLLLLSAACTSPETRRINKLGMTASVAENSGHDWRMDECGKYRFCIRSSMEFDVTCMKGPCAALDEECKETSDYTQDCDADLEDYALYQLRYTPYLVDEYGERFPNWAWQP